MTTHVDEIGGAFLKFAKKAKLPVIGIGAAYGHIALEAASQQTQIIVNDLDQRHLNTVLKRATVEQLKYITTLPGRFPEQLSVKSNSLGAVLICLVLHFFPLEGWIKAVSTIFNWLAPGGKVFITNESPYFGTMKRFIPIYLQRKRKFHPCPGLMMEMTHFDDNRKKDVDSVVNLLSLSETQAVLKGVGFHIEYIKYLDREGVYPPDALYDGRETVGVIAVKK